MTKLPGIIAAFLVGVAAQDIYLYVDNKEEASTGFDASGGKEMFFVNTNASSYTIEDVPLWCSVEDKTTTGFMLMCSENKGLYRSCTILVKAGNKSVPLNVSQDGIPGTELKACGWIERMHRLMEHITKTYSNTSGEPDRYKGELNSAGKRHGMGIYNWSNETYYLGEYVNGARSGVGIYLIGTDGFHFSTCEDCIIYVGDYVSGKASGNGACYDKYGHTMYRGAFDSGFPSSTYPGNGNYADYKFEWVQMADGYYFGETYKGVPHGYGIVFHPDGGARFGQFTDGQKGKGIELPYSSGRVRRED